MEPVGVLFADPVLWLVLSNTNDQPMVGTVAQVRGSEHGFYWSGGRKGDSGEGASAYVEKHKSPTHAGVRFMSQVGE